MARRLPDALGRRLRCAGLALAVLAAAGCTAAPGASQSRVTTPAGGATGHPPSATTAMPTPDVAGGSSRAAPPAAGPTASPPTTSGTPPTPGTAVGTFDPDRVLAGIRTLAAIGPRDAASAASDRAAAVVADRLRAAGYRVTLVPFRVPAGVSWGVRVPAGTSVDVVADPPGFDARAPHVVIGAHLDTVPQSPGAEDDASGLMVMAELARLAARQPPRLPVRFVAFGAEEARTADGTRYAFGSRHLVAGLDAAERRAVRGMLALDRVGVPSPEVPVCHVPGGPDALAQAVRAAAPRSVATRACPNRASDHVSFARVGVPAARIGSVPYAAYHSSRDLPSVVDRAQLARSGAVVWAWLRSLR